MAAKYKLIQSLSRAFSIIDCFTEEEKELTLNEISRKVDLNINTTRGLVQTLLYYDYLAYDKQSNTYRLGTIYLDKAEIAQFDYTEKIIQLIKADLQKIADKYAVSARLIEIDNVSTSTVLESRPSRSRYILTIHSYTDFPLYASATGKLILAELSDTYRKRVIDNITWVKYGKNTITNEEDLLEDLKNIKEKQISFEKDELGDGYSSIAIPVCRENELLFSLSVASTTQIIRDHADELIEELHSVRERIYEQME